ncbi:HpcH/HpaI aldolase/citrate lyase family protein [Lysinibacillus sp. LZ02]|uniref:HpcH/HpaI aldolase/citrate lyase family protein n=1 Tax=Lysinibacillus sp. LZ02 TaxID=3420668 RepID=UPI003D35E841
MRFFMNIRDEALATIFFKRPTHFSKDSSKEHLAYCLGATLYMPATKPHIAQDLMSKKFPNVTSVVVDLEDAVGDLQVASALQNVYENLEVLAIALQYGEMKQEEFPLLFIRVRHPAQLAQLTAMLGALQHLLTGYVFPKFSLDNADDYLTVLQAQRKKGYTLYGMPILETGDILYKEQRAHNLIMIREKLIHHYEAILNIRIGTTDFSGLYGIRRTQQTSLYDIVVVRDCLADIFNVFGRSDYPFVMSGSVWEYFDATMEHNGQTGSVVTKQTVSATEGLIKEVQLDRLNGLIGKTVIHPTHINIVNALHVVTHEEYLDALSIMEHERGTVGVQKSEYANKMNEMKPHYEWARKVLLRAEVYGVFHPQCQFNDLL